MSIKHTNNYLLPVGTDTLTSKTLHKRPPYKNKLLEPLFFPTLPNLFKFQTLEGNIFVDFSWWDYTVCLVRLFGVLARFETCGGIGFKPYLVTLVRWVSTDSVILSLLDSYDNGGIFIRVVCLKCHP